MNVDLVVHPAIRGSVLSTATSAVTLPSGTEYFTISEEGGGGVIRWGTTAANAESATLYHEVAANTCSGVIVANPPTLYIHAEGGNVDYYIYAVRQGRS